MRLSVLDQSPVGAGMSTAEALSATVALAREAESLGYARFWVAEHHDSAGFAGTAPEVLAGVLLSRTDVIRVGTGGVLLPRYPPGKVAEVFGLLDDLYPGRFDLGIGRAGGPAADYPRRIAALHEMLGPSATAGQLWLLGSGGGSTDLAARLGAGFCFAHFLNPEPAAALASYRRALPVGTPARTVLAVRVVVADTEARAAELTEACLLWRARKDLGVDEPIPPVRTVRGHRWTESERRRAHQRERALVHGTAEQVHVRLTALAEAHGVDELMINMVTHDPADRVRGYRLLAEAFGLPGAAGSRRTSGAAGAV